MDYVTRQFINLAKKLRDDLRQTLQKHTNAISQAAKAASESKQNQLPVPLPVIAELQIPEADKTERRTQYDRSHGLQIWLTVGTWLAFIAAAVYAGIAAYQLKAMRGQLEQIVKQYPELQKSAAAAKSSAETAATMLTNAQLQFRTEQRPYLSAGGRGCLMKDNPKQGEGPLVAVSRPDGGVDFCAEIDVLNNGRSPAIEVDMPPVVYKFGPKDKARQEVRSYTPVYRNGTDIVTVGAAWTSVSHVQAFTKDEVALIKSGDWELYVVGGVQYRDIFSPTIPPYETTYCWQVATTGLPFHGCPFKPPGFHTFIK
jgi:hypothetical protein